MGFLQIEGLGKVHYHEYGTGQKLLFAFHGYGTNGKQFSVLKQSLLTKYHVIAFDHFFHGTSVLKDETETAVLAGMQPKFLNAYLTNWFKLYGNQRFSLLGYSVGAKLALFLLENFAEQVDEIMLIAPDGLVKHRGLHFLHSSFIGKIIFKKLTYSNWMMASALKLLNQLKVIDNSLYAIASRETDTSLKRLNAFYTVHFNKNIHPNVKKIATLINQYQIRCCLYFGRLDNLFPAGNSKNFIGLLNKPELHVLPYGHWLVTAKLDQYIANQHNDYQQQAQVIL